MPKTIALVTVILFLCVDLPAQANWACGAIGRNGHGSGWKVSPSKSDASGDALAQCRSSGGADCFVTGCNCVEASTEDTSCLGQSGTEAELNSPEIPPRVFNNIPPRDFSNSERPRTPQAAPEMPVARSAPSGATPNRPSNERAATTGPNGGECDQGDQLLPTGKRIVVNPCSQQPKHLYVPQDQLRHKAPTAERYIHSLSGCRQVVNGVCIDPDMKWPDSQSGGPIYVKP